MWRCAQGFSHFVTSHNKIYMIIFHPRFLFPQCSRLRCLTTIKTSTRKRVLRDFHSRVSIAKSILPRFRSSERRPRRNLARAETGNEKKAWRKKLPQEKLLPTSAFADIQRLSCRFPRHITLYSILALRVKTVDEGRTSGLIFMMRRKMKIINVSTRSIIRSMLSRSRLLLPALVF